MQSIQPEGQTLIVLPLSAQEVETSGGIVINDTVLQKGKVLAVSNELKEVYSINDIIIFPENSGISVRHEDQQCLWVKPMLLDYVGIVIETKTSKKKD